MVHINPMAPGIKGCHLKFVNLILLIEIRRSYCDNALPGMHSDECHGTLLIISQHSFIQVMDWCRQAAILYLCQCWLSCISSYGVTKPQWVRSTCVYRHQIRRTLKISNDTIFFKWITKRLYWDHTDKDRIRLRQSSWSRPNSRLTYWPWEIWRTF